MSTTAIGEEPGGLQTSGIQDQDQQRKTPAEGESVLNDDAGHDLTREDIEAGKDDADANEDTNDGNTSADQLQRAPTSNKIHGDMIDLGK